MEYFKDKEFRYKDELINNLRNYNIKHTGIREYDENYFYIVSGDTLLGALHVNYNWDWVSIGEIFYENLDVLKTLLEAVKKNYNLKVVGIKHYTELKSRIDDFTSIGFKVGGKTFETPKIASYTYLYNIDFNIKDDLDLEVLLSKEKIDKYESIMKKATDIQGIENNLEEVEEEDLMYVALDKGKLVGGIHVSITDDSMYIGYLVVDEAKRGKGIGKRLMSLIEESAKSHEIYSINLGTVSFQAKEFYEKLGYKVVFTKENDPKGFNSFSMVKEL